jgi:hypothetical protein
MPTWEPRGDVRCSLASMEGTNELFTIPVGTAHVVAATGDGIARGLAIASPSAFARLITAVGTPDTALFERRSAEIGDEILGAPGALTGEAQACGAWRETPHASRVLRFKKRIRSWRRSAPWGRFAPNGCFASAATWRGRPQRRCCSHPGGALRRPDS